MLQLLEDTQPSVSCLRNRYSITRTSLWYSYFRIGKTHANEVFKCIFLVLIGDNPAFVKATKSERILRGCVS